MFNEPVKADKFFGRSDLLELLKKRASALKEGYRHNVALSGHSLAGKSSVIMRFLRDIEDEGFIPVYVEVVREPFRNFADKFIATMLYNALVKMGEQCGVELPRLMERSRELLPMTNGAINRIYSLIDRQELEEAYSSLLVLTSILKAETKAPCIVILDEFDNLEEIGVKNPFVGFGKVIMVQKDTMYVVSSSRDSAIRKILSEKLALLFGNFEVVKVGNFDSGCARSFMEMKSAGFDIEDGLKIFLAAFTDGNAFYLDKLVTHAKSIAIEKMASYIDRDTLAEAILHLLYDSGGTIHQYIVSFLSDALDSRMRGAAMSILGAIARGSTKCREMARQLRMKQGEAQKILSCMAEKGIVSRTGVFYRINDAMLEYWIENVHERRRRLLVDGNFDRMAFFKEDVLSYISSFGEEMAKDMLSRISELFGLFSNELVNIDGKSVRLPDFTNVEMRSGPGGSGRYISASSRKAFWVVCVYGACVTENDIIDYIRIIKTLERKPSNRVIITLKGIDENARLIAKELKMSIWDANAVNGLMSFYGRRRVTIS